MTSLAERRHCLIGDMTAAQTIADAWHKLIQATQNAGQQQSDSVEFIKFVKQLLFGVESHLWFWNGIQNTCNAKVHVCLEKGIYGMNVLVFRSTEAFDTMLTDITPTVEEAEALLANEQIMVSGTDF